MEKLDVLALSFKRGIGPKKITEIAERYGSAEEWAREEKTDLSQELERAEGEIRKAERLGIRIITLFDGDYPEKLRNINSPPPVLYVKGNLPSSPAVAVVGSRRCSSYGRRVAFGLSKFLAGRGICIISGLAYGIDSAAHRGALEGGTTVAVLGCGLDDVYPRGNRELAERIVESGGALVSEFPLRTKVSRENFPRRNRIVAGLSDAVVVVEAGKRSGSFITVDFALEQGKEVFSVPGPIDSPFSAGTNRLIKEGAAPLTDYGDILELFPEANVQNEVEVPEHFKPVIEALKSSPKGIDLLSEELKLPVQKLSSLLFELEVLGIVRKEGALYQLC
ncbi:MAG: DNA-processing protein DprA [Desulfurobacteriaceae bacterium]